MPKYKITDIDSTGVVQSSIISNTVYMPGKSCLIKTSATKAKGVVYDAVGPKLFKSISELKTFNFGTGTTAIYYDTESLSYKLMTHLLELGLYVLYEGVVEEEDGVCPSIDWIRLEDKGNYDIRYLTMGGYFVTQAGMITCSQNRGDCIALMCHPRVLADTYALIEGESEPNDWKTSWSDKYNGKVAVRNDVYSLLTTYVPFIAGVYYEEGNDETYTLLNEKPSDWNSAFWVNNKYCSLSYSYDKIIKNEYAEWEAGKYYLPATNQVEKVRAYFESFGAGDTSYAAAFTPNFKTSLESLGGSTTSLVPIPATFGYLFAYATAIKSNPEWYAIAGGSRGLISELTEVDYKYTSADIEMLQGRATSGEVQLDDESDNVGYAINPIVYVRPFGEIVWGNRTFKNNVAIKKTTASSFLNVRNLVCAIKKKLYDAARKYTYEQNSEILWVNFKSQIIPLLDQMKNGNGILGYKFVKLATSAKARLKARLIIIPIEAVEDFEIEVELSDSISTTEE